LDTSEQVDEKRKRAIVIVSIGDRPWLPSVAEIASHYADRCNADLILETEAPSQDEFVLPELPDSPGRPHKRLYACKSFYAWKHLAVSGYRKVLVLDDTCCINAHTPDIFKKIGPGQVGYTITGASDAQRSFDDIHRFQEAMGEPPVPADQDLYMNSGVLVYDHRMVDALAPHRIVAASELLMSRFPHQSLTYYLLRRAEVSMRKLEKKFNVVPAVNLDKEVRRDMTDMLPHLSRDTYIYHITGMYRQRAQIIEQICEHLRPKWRDATTSEEGRQG